MTGGRRLTAAALALAALSWPADRPAAAPASRQELHGIDGLIRVYDDILDARYDALDGDLQRACGPAPHEACDVLDATSVWWRVLLDPDSRALDAEFTHTVEEAIRSTEAWTSREPSSAEAWFYLGGAYAVRVQWRVLRNQKIAAARDGKRIKQALERALALDPDLDDANFGVGLYEYYADIAPTAAKVLRFLLLLPGGNRADGLTRMLRARTHGRLLQGEADYQLHVIYLWYERRTDDALALLEGLRDRYPGNPLFRAQIAVILDAYRHDLMGSLQAWGALLAAAREQRVNEPLLAEVQARLGTARLLDTLHQTDRALEQLRAVIDLKPQRPYGSLAAAWLALGAAQDRLGYRQDAVASYRAAQATAPVDDPRGVRVEAADRLRRAPDESRALAYRLGLQAWRKLERGDAGGAEAQFTQAMALDDRDPVAHYRYGRVLEARHEDPAALAQFDRALRDVRLCPPPIGAEAYLEAARLNERLGHRDRAISFYRAANTWFGAATETRAAARRALARLRAQ